MSRGLVIAVISVGAVGLAGCTEDVDPPWQLDHDRVIAVRATPSRILSGEAAEIDALLGREGEAPIEVDPATAMVVSPTSLASALSKRPTGWFITAPSPAQLGAARTELGLPAGDPVPVRVRVTFPHPVTVEPFVANKVVWLGEHANNPVLEPITIDGMVRTTTAPITVLPAVDVPLAVEFDDSHVVNWLTSCGTMHDFDLAHAYLRVEPEDPQTGTLGVVVRDDIGGVAWRFWSIRAD